MDIHMVFLLLQLFPSSKKTVIILFLVKPGCLYQKYAFWTLWLLFIMQDYQEEIAVAQENKVQLQQMGERLARVSHESKASEIEYKLGKVNDRWQHLLDLMAAR